MSRPAVAARRRIRHPWGLGIGIVLVLPQLVGCVVVLRTSFVVALLGFLMTIGFIRLGSLGYQVQRERTPPVARGWLALIGLAGLLLGSILWGQVRLAQLAASDGDYAGAVAPPATVWLNLVAVLTLGLWLTGAAMLVWSLAGLITNRRRA